MSKINCWVFRNCGRGPGGEKGKKLGICPAATDARLNGINGGTNGGRSCWTVAGTFCFGEIQGTFARKIHDCMDCEFFWLVADEEAEFTPSIGSRHGYSKT